MMYSAQDEVVDIDIEAASPYVDRTFVVVGVVDIVVACAVDTDLMEKSYLSVDEKKGIKSFFFLGQIDRIYLHGSGIICCC